MIDKFNSSDRPQTPEARPLNLEKSFQIRRRRELRAFADETSYPEHLGVVSHALQKIEKSLVEEVFRSPTVRRIPAEDFPNTPDGNKKLEASVVAATVDQDDQAITIMARYDGGEGFDFALIQEDKEPWNPGEALCKDYVVWNAQDLRDILQQRAWEEPAESRLLRLFEPMKFESGVTCNLRIGAVDRRGNETVVDLRESPSNTYHQYIFLSQTRHTIARFMGKSIFE